ncbi:MAG: hypothetical protein Greene041619_1001 [Candidatus Peregrinibacteria bacterium Greene0416_19]|nr:MAG: hypothetical protein Greene041619_1001 [Candidatus Peregrinibacteria bacterium Greene0416_19]
MNLRIDVSAAIAGLLFSLIPAPAALAGPLPACGTPKVSWMLINDGRPQRSMVTKLTVKFDRPVVMDPDAIKIGNRPGFHNDVPLPVLTVAPAGPQTFTVTFGGPGIVGGSIRDGVFDLTIFAKAVRDLCGNPMAADFKQTFHRIFGDQDADLDVDALDLFYFWQAYRQINYVPWFDFDSDGRIDYRDHDRIRERLRKVMFFFGVVKTDGKDAAAPGETLTYSVTLENMRPASLAATITDEVPAGTTFVSASDGGVFDGSAVRWQSLALPPRGQTRTITLVVRVRDDATEGTVITNTAKSEYATIYGTDTTTVKAPQKLSTLTVTQIAMPPTGTVVKNQKNVNLLRFGVFASDADLLFTGASFIARTGSLVNAGKYNLWVDEDFNGIVDTLLQQNAPVRNNAITFDSLAGGGYVIPKGRPKPIIFEVHADIAPSTTAPAQLQLAFHTSSPSYIGAETLDGAPLMNIQTDGSCPSGPCRIFVTTDTATLYQIADQGNLYVTEDTTITLLPRQFLGGTLGDEILRLNFRGEHEAIDVTHLQFTSVVTTAVSVDRLELYREGSTSPFATATVGSCSGDLVPGPMTFCAKMFNQQLIVPAGQDVKVRVRPRLKTDIEGAVSGEALQFYLSKKPVSNDVTGEGAVRASGFSSFNRLSANNENGIAEGEVIIGNALPGENKDIVGQKGVTVLSKIAEIANANPDGKEASLPTGVYPVGQFGFTTAANGNAKDGLNKVVITDWIFNVALTNALVSVDGLQLYNKADPAVRADCTATDLDGNPLDQSVSAPFLVHCRDMTESDVNTTIDQNSTAAFAIELNILNPSVDPGRPSSLQVSMQDLGSVASTDVGARDSHFRWLDRDFMASVPFLWTDTDTHGTLSTLYTK